MLSALSLAACTHAPSVKIYVSKPAQGLVRSQDKEVIPYDKSDGFLCISPEDYEVMATEAAGQ